jgi:hypothetical protein
VDRGPPGAPRQRQPRAGPGPRRRGGLRRGRPDPRAPRPVRPRRGGVHPLRHRHPTSSSTSSTRTRSRPRPTGAPAGPTAPS